MSKNSQLHFRILFFVTTVFCILAFPHIYGQSMDPVVNAVVELKKGEYDITSLKKIQVADSQNVILKER